MVLSCNICRLGVFNQAWCLLLALREKGGPKNAYGSGPVFFLVGLFHIKPMVKGCMANSLEVKVFEVSWSKLKLVQSLVQRSPPCQYHNLLIVVTLNIAHYQFYLLSKTFVNFQVVPSNQTDSHNKQWSNWMRNVIKKVNTSSSKMVSMLKWEAA